MSNKNVEIKYTQLFINNEFVDSIDAESLPVVNPATEEKLCNIQQAGPQDVNKAVQAAKVAFKAGSEWRTMDASNRGRLIYKLADKIEEEIDYISSLETLNNGKPFSASKENIEFAISIFRYFAGWADKIHGKTIPIEGNFFTYTRHEPVGVVGVIIPWNYPMELLATKLAPALACGCTVVLKPSEITPLTALYMAAFIKDIGFPRGVVNVIPGYGPLTGAAIVNHPDVSKITFTGSTAVGQLIMQNCAKTNLKRVSLELGGKSPLIVLQDADFDQAAEYAHEAVMTNQGQCCVAGSRTFVHASIYDRFVEKMKEKAEQRTVGDPFDDKTVHGAQINKVQFEKILNYIKSGQEEGAKLVTGGSKSFDRGYFIQPTVFADVQDHMRIAKEEIFGPVQSIIKFDSIEEAIERANASSYGLGAAIFSKNIDKVMPVVEKLQAGTVWVNCYLDGSASAPFGGFKKSGFGREMSEYGLQEYIEVKTVTIAVPEKNS